MQWQWVFSLVSSVLNKSVLCSFNALIFLSFLYPLFLLFMFRDLSLLLCLGLGLVANELEDPFRNVPNDIPLNNFQAQFNEALVCMFAGFHPEAWWDIDESKHSLGGENLSREMGIESQLIGSDPKVHKMDLTSKNVNSDNSPSE
jgi:hypothetical protein